MNPPTHHCFHNLPRSVSSEKQTRNQPGIDETPLCRQPQKRIRNVFFRISYTNCSKPITSSTSTWTFFVHQKRPMELRGDFQDHICLDFKMIQGQFWRIACNKDKANTNRAFQEDPERSRLAQTQARWRGWAKPSGYILIDISLINGNIHFPENRNVCISMFLNANGDFENLLKPL